MNNYRTVAVGLSLLALAQVLSSTEVLADSPAQQIKETIQRVITIVDPSAGTGELERRELLRDVLMPRFDFPEMAKRSLGKHWNREPERQQEFVSVFAEFLGNNYAGKILSFKDEKIVFSREWTEKETAEVDTKVVTSNGETLSVNYRLHRVQGEWKIYDVVVENISLVGNYRSQFSRILSNGSFDELIERLKGKESRNDN